MVHPPILSAYFELIFNPLSIHQTYSSNVRKNRFLIDHLVTYLFIFWEVSKEAAIFDQPFSHKNNKKMPRSPEQFNDIRKQKKQLIMDTALELFAENGFHATSISQIAAKAKISKGLTYNYFESKDQILSEIMDQGFNEIYENLDINHDGALTEEEFIYFIRRNFKLVRENTQYWKLLFSLLLQPKVSLLFAESYKEKAGPIMGMFYQFIVSCGSNDPEKDLMAVSAMIEGAFLYLVAAPEIFEGDKMEQAVIDNCLKIIKTN